MSKTTVLLILLLITAATRAQDSVRHRIIFIGDAGEPDKEQQDVLSGAARHAIPGKTTVMFLGDNIYPTGMPLQNGPALDAAKDILRKQFMPMRAKGAPVYFIPGNHDWDRMGSKGLAKIRRQWQFLEEQQDSLLKLVPANGCPDPVEIPAGDSTVIIAFDSEWWLFQHSKTNTEADCSCNSKEEVVARMEELLYRNRYKTILLASHHPFQSYGHHGGYYSWKDHLFPLTAINKNLLLPLPVAGSLYPLLRKTFTSPEDMSHPAYKEMIRKIDGVFAGFPNLVHVAGHEHGLQFIKSNQLQIVSGAGSKEAYVKKGADALFAETVPGFVTVDVLPGNRLHITYYTYKDGKQESAFNYEVPYTSVKQQEELAYREVPGDSIVIRPNPAFDSVSHLHRYIFGENYRKEYAAATKVPVIRLSAVHGGLTPTQRGGGHQSRSLRLEDSKGREWVLRSVQKYPDVLLPEALRETFAKDLLSDNMSSQHPFGALIVPPIANAVKVPHTNPVIGWVAPDKNLGMYAKDFANTLNLLEEREPAGKSDNTGKMLRQLSEDNDNSIDARQYMRAVMLDLLIGDWDRHPDQWRWHTQKKDKGKNYIAVPRDRDQVFFITDGVIPKFASRPWLLPYLQGYDSSIKNVNNYLWESRVVNNRVLTTLPHEVWQETASEFVQAVTDSVIHTAIARLPEPAYSMRKDLLTSQMQKRRNSLPQQMETYYRFLNRIADVQASDKNELIEIKDAPGNTLSVYIRKKTKEGNIRDTLFSKTFHPAVTREIRLYAGKGNDSIVLSNHHSEIKLRLIGGEGDKRYHIEAARQKVLLYERTDNAIYTGDTNRLRRHLANDSLNTAFVPTDLYHKTMPLLNVGYNYDDGIMFGLMIRHLHKGFRKLPYASMHQFSFLHSFLTTAFSFKYRAEWLNVLGKGDLLLNANVLAPDNTQNFFGRGNETVYNKTGDFKNHYRTRFELFQLRSAVRWKNGHASFQIGPAFEVYAFNADKNEGRFIYNSAELHSYDSATIDKTKLFGGVHAAYILDNRNNKLLPEWGSYVNIQLQSGIGMNGYSRSYVQLLPEVAFYKSIGNGRQLVIANRLGGGITIGESTFYQSAFLGGHENLLGYRQYRFAGQHMLYNNLEARIRLANINGYILPGQIGLVGFYDIGKVWERNHNSSTWHQGTGGGIYFAPALMTVVKFVVGKSSEGWYPYLTLGMRF
ncbi:BamA/TamA family outer membrane protein [Sediminibacterium ginsengisoli]|uniref:Calcineurin-like phosphoesterase n=1 Tax=Sediminibacterium ginsengisoli TaxID=413434 RepID=A0A1T4RLI6_9BACT|nr:BamA/TamA family outer membrane protein [Sediminibacterium ginsengisoli]SKA16656.1 Calcineurin-like phosphoesterase [Sediminibacterium ginsengisoli]